MEEIRGPEWEGTRRTDGADENDPEKKETAQGEEAGGSGREGTVPGEDVTASKKEEAVCEEEASDSDKEEAVPDTEAEAVPGKEDAILESLSALSDKLDQMNLLFAKRIQYTAHEEKILDRMHAELQKYKDDMYAQLVRPILLDIIEIRDSIRRVSSSWASKPEFASKPEQERVIPLKTFSDYMLDIRDILEKNNIAVYDSKEGDAFSASRQRAIKKVTTPAEELHGKIAESFNSGYEYMGKIISPEKVAVYIYQKNEATEGGN